MNSLLTISRRALPFLIGIGVVLFTIVVGLWVWSYCVTEYRYSHQSRSASGHQASFSCVTFRTYRGLLDIQLRSVKRQYSNTNEFDAYLANADQQDDADVPFGPAEANFSFAGLGYSQRSYLFGIVASKHRPGWWVAHKMHYAIVPYWMLCGMTSLATLTLVWTHRMLRRRNEGTGFPFD